MLNTHCVKHSPIIIISLQLNEAYIYWQMQKAPTCSVWTTCKDVWHTIITKFPLLLQFHKTQCTRLYLHHLLVKMWDHVLSDILGSTAKHFYDLEKKQPPTSHTIIYCHTVTMCWVLATHVVSISRVRVECSELEANDVSKQHQKMVSSACIKLLKTWECDIAMVERGQVQMYE